MRSITKNIIYQNAYPIFPLNMILFNSSVYRGSHIFHCHIQLENRNIYYFAMNILIFKEVVVAYIYNYFFKMYVSSEIGLTYTGVCNTKKSFMERVDIDKRALVKSKHCEM